MHCKMSSNCIIFLFVLCPECFFLLLLFFFSFILTSFTHIYMTQYDGPQQISILMCVCVCKRTVYARMYACYMCKLNKFGTDHRISELVHFTFWRSNKKIDRKLNIRAKTHTPAPALAHIDLYNWMILNVFKKKAHEKETEKALVRKREWTNEKKDVK